MAKFFGVTPQQREQMKNKDNPDYKKKNKSQTSWILLVVLVVFAIISVFLPGEFANFEALGFARFDKFFWLPLIFAIFAIAYVFFAYSLKKYGLHYLTQFILGCIASVLLIVASCMFFILSFAYKDGYQYVAQAERVSGKNFDVAKGSAYTMVIDDVYVTYYERPSDWSKHDYNIPLNITPIRYLSMCSFDPDEIPATTTLYDFSIFNITDNQWIGGYQVAPGTYDCFVVLENLYNTAGILITNVTITIE